MERILRYLSDDRLAGRGSFTPANEEAARFIAGEFSTAGLRPAPGSDSLLARFTVNRVIPESVFVLFNGIPIPPGDLIVSTDLERGSRALSDSFPVHRMGDSFDRGLFRKSDCILLIPRIHERVFRRYQQSMGRPRVFPGDPRPGILVAILTDSANAGSCRVDFRGRTETPSLANVVGVIPGKNPDEIVLFSAHYDHLGIVREIDGDSIANGADDNASGTAALIALAKYFAAQGTPGRTLVFAALAAEEIGGFGARHLLNGMKPDHIAAMVNLEMLGTVSKFGRRAFWLTGYERSALGAMMSETLDGSGYKIFPDPYPDENLFFRSDNAVFARAGVPAHTISTTRIDIDTVYHTVNDEFARLDVGYLTETVRGIALGVRGIVDGRQTPGRISIK
ncbi:MAG TPA: M20/M25/M40 family metallo-hydrolase [Bacteroidota bacterium]|nr:M20/M25/M40 family metallo-hydrolase [Bacteroidota bacterium]